MFSYIIVEGINDLLETYLIRKKVFVEEQNISYEDEYDFVENDRIVILVKYNGINCATGRINIKGNIANLERICVLKEYRNLSIGKYLINILINISKDKNCNLITLGAQLQALGFYRKLGFKEFGDNYLDANILHQNMKLELI